MAAAVAAAVAAVEADTAAAVEAAVAAVKADTAAAVAELASLQVKYDAVVAKMKSLINEKRIDFVCKVMRERFARMHERCAYEARSPFLCRRGFG